LIYTEFAGRLVVEKTTLALPAIYDKGITYMKLSTLIQATILVALFGFLSACGGRTNIESDLGIKGAPDWVNEGTQAVSDKKGRVIQGVGMSVVLGDFSLQKSTADARARAEIARVLSSYVESTMSDFTASSGGQLDASIEREIKSKTTLALSGARILGHWKDKKSGDVYAFAELDMKEVDATLQAATAMSDGFQKYYSQKAASGFDRFFEEKQ
jgi:hypothetical protein